MIRDDRFSAARRWSTVAGPVGKVGWKVLGLAFAIPTGIVVNKTLEKVWRRSRGSAPPKNPAAPNVDWLDALVWAAISGVVVAGARVVANRGAAATYQTLTGRLPPGVDEEKP
jgi:hypothetical protein